MGRANESVIDCIGATERSSAFRQATRLLSYTRVTLTRTSLTFTACASSVRLPCEPRYPSECSNQRVGGQSGTKTLSVSPRGYFCGSLSLDDLAMVMA